MGINKKVLGGVLLSFMCLIMGACSEKEEGKQVSGNYTVNGKVEKGPFIKGTTIELQPMSASMNALGTVFSSTISSNSGEFTFGTKEFETPFAQLTANGYFYNEVSGSLSKGMITLRDIVNLADKSTVNVNLLTHLKSQRILNLMAEGKSFDEANTMAQKELLTAFGLQRFAHVDASQYSISAGNGEAGALIAISSLIIADRTEAELTEYLAEIGEDFGKNGSFSESVKQQMKKDRDRLSQRLERIQANIVSRYEELGMAVSVEDLSYFFDWNDDGIAGNEILGSDSFVTLDKSELQVPKEGGTYTIQITSSIPVTLASDNIGGDQMLFPLYDVGKISHTETIEGDKLKVIVTAAGNMIMDQSKINICDYRGNVVAVLVVNQDGVDTGKLFSDQGAEYIMQASLKFSESIESCHAMDARYTKLISDPDFVAPIPSYNSNLLRSWASVYAMINRSITIARIDKNDRNLLSPSLNTLNALCYYNLVTYWGNVPYRILDNSDNFELPQTPKDKLEEALEVNLKDAIDKLKDKKNRFADNAEDLMFFSKDVPRIILADIYMSQGKYSAAKALLKKVESGNFYQLESSMDYSDSSKELIFGVEYSAGGRSVDVTPILVYADVILSLAECEYHLGDMDSAKKYLNAVASKKGISASTADIITGIKEVRKKVSMKCGGYFSFLKRNNLAISELGLKDYQLLLPIPSNEVSSNPAIVQNPGYNR